MHIYICKRLCTVYACAHTHVHMCIYVLIYATLPSGTQVFVFMLMFCLSGQSGGAFGMERLIASYNKHKLTTERTSEYVSPHASRQTNIQTKKHMYIHTYTYIYIYIHTHTCFYIVANGLYFM